jgi:soluble cytochrome b562
MRSFCLSLFLICTGVLANPAVDLEKTMKNMAFQYKKAYDMQQSSELLPVLDQLIDLTHQALQAEFSPEKALHFKQGLQQVLTELHAAKRAAQQDDIAAAKARLRQVDTLRKQYHKQREVSIWDLLFG